MFSRDLLSLKGDDVEALLRGREREIMEAVKGAYVAHAAGESSLPNSLFLNFPGRERDRLIALPAYLGRDQARLGGGARLGHRIVFTRPVFRLAPGPYRRTR